MRENNWEKESYVGLELGIPLPHMKAGEYYRSWMFPVPHIS